MIKKGINAYYNGKLKFIKEIALNGVFVFDEAEFFDDGYLKVKIEHLKKELSNVLNELKIAYEFESKDEYTLSKIKGLEDKQEDIMIEMCFYASNGFNSLDMCKEMLENIECDFAMCLDALIAYKEGRIAEAFKLFHNYFSKMQRIPKHYLINKTYGSILMTHGEDKMALKFLRAAAEVKPEDMELHKAIAEVYKRNNMERQLLVEKSILSILGGRDEDDSILW